MSKRRIHCYAAIFGDDLARKLIKRHGGGTVFDPFAGSGTTLIEALKSGHHAIGIDVDPIACLICRVQTRKYSDEWLTEFEKATLNQLEVLKSEILENPPKESNILKGSTFAINGQIIQIPDHPEIDFWFSPKHKVILGTFVSYAQTLKDERQREILELTISSSIIRKWPNTLSLAMDIDHSRPHKAEPKRKSYEEHFALFRRVFRESIRILRNQAAESDGWLSEGEISQGNSAEIMRNMKHGSVDLILTSPPYANAIDYPRSHKFSEWWLTPETRICKRSNYIGLRGYGGDSGLRQKAFDLAPKQMASISWLEEGLSAQRVGLIDRYVADMYNIIEGCKHVLKPEGKVVFVLADNKIKGRRIPIINIVAEMLERVGFSDVSAYVRNIKPNRRRYPFGVNGFRGIMQTEAVISATRK